MNSNTLVVVGDKFQEFAEAENTITLSQLENIIQIPSKVFLNKQKLVPGLGCRRDLYSQFISLLEDDEIPAHLDLEKFFLSFKNSVEPNKFTHQHSEHNILIGKAVRDGDSNFSVPFIIDERSTLMGDHQTGKHVQGMIITEAFRQTFIAISEEFYLVNDDVEKYFVINDMNIKFINFVFPLPASIRFELLDIDTNDFRSKFKVKMILEQNGTIAAIMDAQFVVYPDKYIRKKEKELADKGLSFYLSSLKDASGILNHESANI